MKTSFSFPSSGNEEQDEAKADAIRKREDLLNANKCPNKCGQMDFIDDYSRQCPVCRFQQWSNAPLKKP